MPSPWERAALDKAPRTNTTQPRQYERATVVARSPQQHRRAACHVYSITTTHPAQQQRRCSTSRRCRHVSSARGLTSPTSTWSICSARDLSARRRDLAEMQPRYGRDTVEMQSRCGCHRPTTCHAGDLRHVARRACRRQAAAPLAVRGPGIPNFTPLLNRCCNVLCHCMLNHLLIPDE